MGPLEGNLNELRSKVEHLEQENAYLRQELNENQQENASLRQELNEDRHSEMRRTLRRRVKRKMEDSSLKKRLAEFDLTLQRCEKPCFGILHEIKTRRVFEASGYYSRCFRVHFARRMKLEWPDFSCALKEERDRMRDGAWWGERYHSELLGHLKTVGFSMEHWECSLMFWADDLQFFQCEDPAKDDRSSLNNLIRGHKELIICEDGKHFFSPKQIETFAKIFEVFETQDDFFL